jgi:hypothetical protein
LDSFEHRRVRRNGVNLSAFLVQNCTDRSANIHITQLPRPEEHRAIRAGEAKQFSGNLAIDTTATRLSYAEYFRGANFGGRFPFTIAPATGMYESS